MKPSTPKFLGMSSLAMSTVAAMALLLACTPTDSKQGGRSPTGAASSQGGGRRISEGATRNLRASSDGQHLAFVTSLNDVPDKTASEQIRTGNLAIASVATGNHRVIGRGVTTLSGAYAFSPDSAHIAFLENFDLAKGRGSLKVASLSPKAWNEAPQALASGVDFFGFSPDGALLAYVAKDGLHLRTLSSGADQLVDDAVATFEFSSDGAHLAYRKSSAQGGTLVLAKASKDGAVSSKVKVASFAGDYAFSKDGRFLALTARGTNPAEPYEPLIVDLSEAEPSPVSLGSEAGNFVFSKDSKALAFIANQTPGMPYGDLFLVSLASSPLAKDLKSQAVKVGSSVADFRFSPTSDAIALRENHRDERGRMWQTFGVRSVPSGEKLFHQSALPNAFISYLFSADGEELAFVKHVKADVNLWRIPAKTASSTPELVAPWTYQYRFFRDEAASQNLAPGSSERELFFLGDCVREGRECALYAAKNAPVVADAPVSSGEAASDVKAGDGDSKASDKAPQKPSKPALKRHIASGISSFVTPADAPGKLFLNLPRLDTMDGFDLARMTLDSEGKGGPMLSMETSVLKDSLVFLDAQGHRVAYVVSDRKRAGVYVAEVD